MADERRRVVRRRGVTRRARVGRRWIGGIAWVYEGVWVRYGSMHAGAPEKLERVLGDVCSAQS